MIFESDLWANSCRAIESKLEYHKRLMDTRILLVNHEPEARSALREALAQEPGLKIVAEAEDTLGMLSRARLTQPDVVLLDWDIPNLNKQDLLFAIQCLFPNPLVIVRGTKPDSRREAMSAGAAAFVSKCDPPEVLIVTLRGLSTRPI